MFGVGIFYTVCRNESTDFRIVITTLKVIQSKFIIEIVSAITNGVERSDIVRIEFDFAFAESRVRIPADNRSVIVVYSFYIAENVFTEIISFIVINKTDNTVFAIYKLCCFAVMNLTNKIILVIFEYSFRVITEFASPSAKYVIFEVYGICAVFNTRKQPRQIPSACHIAIYSGVAELIVFKAFRTESYE